MSLLDDLEDYRLEACFQRDPDCVVHTSYKADWARGLRKVAITEKWAAQKPPLGSGTFGTVFLQKRLGTDPSTRAVKQLAKEQMTRLKVDYRKELLALTKFSRSKFARYGIFVEFLGWFEDDASVFIAMEYFPHGTLDNYITAEMKENDTQTISMQLLEGLKLMHKEGFTHRDLKPQNIFVVQKMPIWWVKIGDFGITKRVSNEETLLQTATGTPHYLAPEVFHYVESDDEEKESSSYTNAVDIWSFGCVVYEMMALQVPFPEYPRSIVKFCKGGPFPEEPLAQRITRDGIEFIKNVLIPQPASRPTVREVIKASWLRAGNFQNTVLATDVTYGDSIESCGDALLQKGCSVALGIESGNGSLKNKSEHEGKNELGTKSLENEKVNKNGDEFSNGPPDQEPEDQERNNPGDKSSENETVTGDRNESPRIESPRSRSPGFRMPHPLLDSGEREFAELRAEFRIPSPSADHAEHERMNLLTGTPSTVGSQTSTIYGYPLGFERERRPYTAQSSTDEIHTKTVNWSLPPTQNQRQTKEYSNADRISRYENFYSDSSQYRRSSSPILHSTTSRQGNRSSSAPQSPICIVSPPRETQNITIEKPLKGILRSPRDKFPEDPDSSHYRRSSSPILHSTTPRQTNRSSSAPQTPIRISSPPRETQSKEKPLKGILRSPRDKFPEDPTFIPEGVASLEPKDGIPPNTTWTKISRDLVNPAALEAGLERFQETADHIIVLRALSKAEIDDYASKTERIRAAREEKEAKAENYHQECEGRQKSADRKKKARLQETEYTRYRSRSRNIETTDLQQKARNTLISGVADMLKGVKKGWEQSHAEHLRENPAPASTPLAPREKPLYESYPSVNQAYKREEMYPRRASSKRSDDPDAGFLSHQVVNQDHKKEDNSSTPRQRRKKEPIKECLECDGSGEKTMTRQKGSKIEHFQIFCPYCNGGSIRSPIPSPEEPEKKCSECDGKGTKIMMRQMGPMIQRFEVPCPDCSPSPPIPSPVPSPKPRERVKKCSECDGKGTKIMMRQMGPMIQRFEVPCPDCSPSPPIPSPAHSPKPRERVKKCHGCDGKGTKTMMRQMGPMIQRFQTVCTDCNGDGEIIYKKEK